MQRRSALFGVWLAGTLVAAALAVLAVGLAGSRVTSRAVPVVSREAVTEELASEVPATTPPASVTTDEFGGRADNEGTSQPAVAGAAPGTPDPTPPGAGGFGPDPVEPPPGVPSSPSGAPRAPDDSATRAAGLAPAGDEDGGTSGRSPGGPSSGASGGTGSTDGGRGSGSSPGGPPSTAASITTAPPTTTRTITSTAGSIDVRCSGATATLLGAVPASGYTALVVSPGGQEVRVQLLDAGRKGNEIRARCTNGSVVAEVSPR